jgi:hypothetical protein
MLASFLGVLPILTPPLCALAFIMSLIWYKEKKYRVCLLHEGNILLKAHLKFTSKFAITDPLLVFGTCKLAVK